MKEAFHSYTGPKLAMAKSFICWVLQNLILYLSHTSGSQEWVLAGGRGEQSQKPALPSPLRLFKKLRLKKGRKSTKMLIPKIKINLKNDSYFLNTKITHRNFLKHGNCNFISKFSCVLHHHGSALWRCRHGCA